MGFLVLGTGGSVPSRAVKNDELTFFLDTDDEWISTRTGIRERRVCVGESITDLAESAARAALDMAGVKPRELDFIICSTVRGDKAFPSLACLLQERLSASCAGIDINAACAGFVYALDMADVFMKVRGYKRVLVVCGEAMSRIVDWRDRSTCVLFGDGAGAVVLGPSDDRFISRLSVTGDWKVLYADNSTGNSPYAENSEGCYVRMNGQEVYKFAVSAIEHDILYLCGREGIRPSEVDFFLLHQANRRIIDAARTRLRLPEEKFPVNIDRYGNISSATIPLLLDELNRAGALKPGQRLLMSAFGAGLTTGSCLFRWQTKA